jgi:hypothetical protein
MLDMSPMTRVIIDIISEDIVAHGICDYNTMNSGKTNVSTLTTSYAIQFLKMIT